MCASRMKSIDPNVSLRPKGGRQPVPVGTSEDFKKSPDFSYAPRMPSILKTFPYSGSRPAPRMPTILKQLPKEVTSSADQPVVIRSKRGYEDGYLPQYVKEGHAGCDRCSKTGLRFGFHANTSDFDLCMDCHYDLVRASRLRSNSSSAPSAPVDPLVTAFLKANPKAFEYTYTEFVPQDL